jgi:hypothetical protein
VLESPHQVCDTARRASGGGGARAKGHEKVLEFIQEKTGIYSLGFAKESFLGLVIPVLFVLIIGGLGAILAFVL